MILFFTVVGVYSMVAAYLLSLARERVKRWSGSPVSRQTFMLALAGIAIIIGIFVGTPFFDDEMASLIGVAELNNPKPGEGEK